VELMGGEMWLESPPTTVIEEVVPSVGHGRGAAFFFTVRLDCHGPPAAKPVPDERAGFLLEPVTGRILLADDDSTNRLLTATVLEHLGLIVDTAENGRQVLEKMKENTFDLVLMDVQMPEMDGFAATGAIREAERGTSQHVPIIALTAFAMQDDRERCLAAGMDDYLAKPVAAAEIKRLILRYLRQK
ncbi:MAG: response regulator, partial [Deltaproteobacteria bacterium]